MRSLTTIEMKQVTSTGTVAETSNVSVGKGVGMGASKNRQVEGKETEMLEMLYLI